jgi:hypothetical protein
MTNRRRRAVVAIGLAAMAVWARADDPPFATGLVPPTPEEQAWDRAHLIQAQRIRLNPIGRDRVNAHRRSRGQAPLAASVNVAPFGQEVDGLTLDEIDRLGIRAVPADAPSDLPPSVDNSTLKYFPPIRSQGSLGSCAQWTAIYYTLTHMNALIRDLDAKNGTDAVRLSPKFTYNFLNNGENKGTWITNGWNIVSNHGVPSWQDWPYNSDYRSWPRTAALYRNALNVRVDRTGSIRNCDTPTGMSEIKTLLMNGYVFSIATYIYSWQFKTISNDPSTTEDDAFAGKQACHWVNGTSGGHGMTVVGYNDDIWVDINNNGIVDTGEKGAFRIANSWGSGWKDGGFIWMAYDALKAVTAVSGGPSSGRQTGWWSDGAMWVTAKQSYTPTALAEITLNHVKRNQIGVPFGLSSTTETVPSTYWFPQILMYSGGAYSFSGGSTAEDGTFVFDLSSLNAPVGTLKRWYLRHQDSGAGEPSLLKSFKWINVADSVEVVKGNLPASMDNAFAFYYVDATLTSGTANTAPTLSDFSSAAINEDTATSAVAFTVGDAQTAAGSLVLTGASSNLSLIPNGNIVFSGSGSSRSLVVTPAPDKFGSALITIRVTDAGGLWTEKFFTLTVNPVNDRPVAQSQTTYTALNTSKSIVLTATDVDAQSLTYSAVAPVRGTLSGTPPQVVYTPPIGFVGIDTFTFTAADGSLTSTPASVTVRIDTAPPTITITNPISGQSVSQLLEIWATANDDFSVSRVDFLVDGSIVGNAESSPYRLSWNTQTVANGSHSLTARAYDSANNSTLSGTVSVTVSNSGTTTLLASPSSIHFDAEIGGIPVPPRPVTVSEASGGSTGFLWNVTASPFWLSVSPGSGYGSGIVIVSVAITDLAAGSYSGTVTFSDGATASFAVPVTLTVVDGSDQTPPSTPGFLSAAMVGPSRVLLSWRPSTDSGGSGLARYRLFRNNAVIAQPTNTVYTDTGLTAGASYEYSIQAEDIAGNYSPLSDPTRITLTENAESDTARVLSYPEPARNGAEPVIRAIIDGAQGVEITIYDANGQVVHSARMDAPNRAVDGRAAFDYAWTGSIPSGVYYAVVTDSTGEKKVRAKTKITVVR